MSSSRLLTLRAATSPASNERDASVKSESSSRGKRSVESHSPSGSTTSSAISSSQATNLERLREAVYVRYLFEDFVLSPSGSGWLAQILPKLYATAASDSTLNLAVRAAAYAYIGNRRQAPELQIEAREMYGRSLKALASDLTNLEVATSTSTLTALLVLGLHEVNLPWYQSYHESDT